MRWSRLLCLFTLLAVNYASVDGDLVGKWDLLVPESPGGDLRFGLEIEAATDEKLAAYIVNGSERIVVPTVNAGKHDLTLKITHYDSVIEARYEKDEMSGGWRKRIGKDQWIEMKFRATRSSQGGRHWEIADAYAGRWSVDFARSDDPAVADLTLNRDGSVSGTFQTTTGDYRYLHGGVLKQQLEISCFDGAHAFLFHARIADDGSMKGDFWSSTNWHEGWVAVKNPLAEMPDAFKQTILVRGSRIGEYAFPDLSGKKTRLDDPKFGAKARMIYVFGSWCPNCHDAAAYFSELQRKYSNDLSILGLAFEVTGDFERDVVQVKRYLKRHAVDYPVLIAGLSDKKLASEAIPFLDKVRSYPTTIFLNSDLDVVSIHTGFSGPATGKAHQNLKQRFEEIIDSIITDSK